MSLIGRGQRIGVGLQYIKVPDPQLITLEEWNAGLRLDNTAENLPPNATSDALDMLVNDHGSLERMLGIEIIESFAPHDPLCLFTHAGLDASTELVMFDSPYIGVKAGDAATIWTDRSLPAGDAWDACVHGDSLMFSNGKIDVFFRLFGSDVVTPLGWDYADTLASFAGRVFAGGGSIGGVANPLGVKWTGASGLPTDLGLGSGAELLLADVAEGDRVMKLLPMSFDLLAIVNRKSVWTGSRTGDPYHPAYFAPVAGQVGTVSKYTVKGGPGFIMFLSDSGVKLFDGSQVRHVSTAIDKELLPISYQMIGKYGAAFSPVDMEYELFTPKGTWIYNLQNDRWLRSSADPIRAATLFNPVTVDITSDPAGWGLFWSGAWGDNVVFTNTVIGDVIYLKDSSLGKESSEAFANFGVVQTPHWQLPVVPLGEFDKLFTMKRMLLHYEGEGTVQLWGMDERGDERLLGIVVLALGGRTKRTDFVLTGRNVTARLEIVGGSPTIKRVQILGEPRQREVA